MHDGRLPFAGTVKTVEDGWIDYNGHLNMAYYGVLFDRTVEEVFDELGLGRDYRARSNCSWFSLAAAFHYLRELKAGDEVGMTFQLLDMDAKRAHFILEMYHLRDGYRAATMESLAAHVDLEARRTLPMPPDIHDRLTAVWEKHKDLPPPAEAGQIVGIRRKRN